MNCSIRTFSTFLKDVDQYLEEVPSLSALDGCVGQLAKVLGFDSAWYGFLGWDAPRVDLGAPTLARDASPVMHGTVALNLPGDFYQSWRAMCHEDMLLDQIRRAPQRVATYSRRQPDQTDGMMAMVDRYDVASIATATQMRTNQKGSLFVACLRNGASSVRTWRASEQDFLYGAVEVLDRRFRDRADGNRIRRTGAKGIALQVSAAGVCVFGGARLREWGIDIDGPLRYELQAEFRRAMERSEPSVAQKLGLIITATPNHVDGGGGLRELQVEAILPVNLLSPREAEVAALLAQGLSHKQVARQLDIAPATVRNQTSRIYDKLGVNNRATLAAALASTTPDRSASP